MPRDLPLAIIKFTVWAYWLSVIGLAVYKRLRVGHGAGVIPRQSRERWMWFIMVPGVLAWNLLPALAVNNSHRPGLGVPGWAIENDSLFLARCAAAGFGVVCYLVTAYCWMLMGRNWSLAVVPEQRTELVTRGLYAWVRHPIYSLSVFLMICTAVVLPTWPMLLVALTHVGLLNLKASSEERYLAQLHGPSYARYCHNVGRFWPRLTRRIPTTG